MFNDVHTETNEENDFIKKKMIKGRTRFVWTSGRKCNFKGCDREDLQPTNVNGWFWSGSGVKMAPTNSTPPKKGNNPNPATQPEPTKPTRPHPVGVTLGAGFAPGGRGGFRFSN